MNILTKPKHIIKSTVLGASALVLLVAPGAAFAQGGQSGGDGGHNRSPQASSIQKHSDSQDRHRKDDDNARKHQEDKQKTCAEQQQALNQRAAKSLDRSTKQLNGLNIVFSGIQTYVASGAVTVENYDALNATATADQTAATTAVSAIQAPQLNCDDPATNSDSANADLSNNIKTAKQALNVYRHDVKNLFEAAING